HHDAVVAVAAQDRGSVDAADLDRVVAVAAVHAGVVPDDEGNAAIDLNRIVAVAAEDGDRVGTADLDRVVPDASEAACESHVLPASNEDRIPPGATVDRHVRAGKAGVSAERLDKDRVVAVATEDADARTGEAEALHLDVDGIVAVATVDAGPAGLEDVDAVIALAAQDADARAEARLDRVVAGAAVDAAPHEGAEVADAVVA